MSFSDVDRVKDLAAMMMLKACSITPQQAKYFLKYLDLGGKYRMYSVFAKFFLERQLVSPKFNVKELQ